MQTRGSLLIRAPHVPTTKLRKRSLTAVHLTDHEAIVRTHLSIWRDAERDQHLHREPGAGRHPGDALLRAAIHHLGRHQHLDLRLAHVPHRHLHPGNNRHRLTRKLRSTTTKTETRNGLHFSFATFGG